MTNTKKLVYTALCAVLICLCAMVTLQIFTIPFSLQVFGVVLSLLLLGGKGGIAATALYIVIGAVGLPVFSGFKGGFQVLLGPTGGYIWGFLLIGLCYIVFKEKFWSLFIGLFVLYAAGTVQFCIVTSTAPLAALSMCVFPFIIPDVVKILLAMLVSNRLAAALGKR